MGSTCLTGNPMLALTAAIFAASLLGSLHCAGMCGGFLALALGDGTSRRLRWDLAWLYHGGRLVTYATLGAIAGGLGGALDLGTSLAGLRPAAAAVAGAGILAFGLVSLGQCLGWTAPRRLVPPATLSAVGAMHRGAMSMGARPRAAALGLCTGMLPCGWLYAFVITAAGTASIPLGALAMSAFWAGTLPVMVTLGAGLRTVIGLVGAKAPVVASVALMAVGGFTLASRTLIDPAALMDKTVASAAQPDQTNQPAVPALSDVPACCQP